MPSHVLNRLMHVTVEADVKVGVFPNLAPKGVKRRCRNTHLRASCSCTDPARFTYLVSNPSHFKELCSLAAMFVCTSTTG